MHKFSKLKKLILQTFILYFFLLTANISAIEKYYRGESVSNYFSGVVSLQEDKYEDSYKFFKNLDSLEDSHSNYSKSYIETLINNSKINEAYRYSNKLKKKKINFFQSDIVIISKYIKTNNFDKAYDYISLVKRSNFTPLQELLSEVLFRWVELKKFELNYFEAQEIFKTLNPRYKNINRINDVFLNCYFDTVNTDKKFQNLINDDDADFSRYAFFYANYLLNKNQLKKANFILEEQLKESPRNLLINQLKINIETEELTNIKNNFNCKNISHIIAELFYITANALSSQNLYSLSNLYINLAKYLNQDFYSYNTLLAENFLMIENYKKANKIYLVLKKFGEIYSWHSSKQLALIEVQRLETEKAIKLMEKSYLNLNTPNLYQTYDFAQFLKNNKEFEKSIKYYSKVLKDIPNTHDLYPKAKDGRGIAYEQIGDWPKAEKDFLDSLKAKPDQAYVINYLAYSWIEKGVKIEKSLKMLEEANQLKVNDGYITDSLGWALYKLERYSKAKEYLKRAVQLMPSDPIVNDHFADVLWMNGEKLQARYYWKYVLNLKDVEDDLKNTIEKKILNGPASFN